MPPVLKVVASGALFMVLLVLALYLKNHNPETGAGRFPPCVIRKFTGFHCPGCGTTRSAHAVLNGDLAGAWRKNPAFVISLPFIVGGFLIPWLRWLLPGVSRKIEGYTSFIPYRLTYIALWLLLLFGVLRNIPVEPFTLLAPR